MYIHIYGRKIPSLSNTMTNQSTLILYRTESFFLSFAVIPTLPKIVNRTKLMDTVKIMKIMNTM